MLVTVSLKVPEEVRQRYGRAARNLRRVMTSAAPTAEQLMVAELTERAPSVIAVDFLERAKRRPR